MCLSACAQLRLHRQKLMEVFALTYKYFYKLRCLSSLFFFKGYTVSWLYS